MNVGKLGRIKNNSTVDFVLNKEPSFVKCTRIVLGSIKKNMHLEWDILKRYY
jgi:hypothetical protein